MGHIFRNKKGHSDMLVKATSKTHDMLKHTLFEKSFKHDILTFRKLLREEIIKLLDVKA